MGGAIVVVHRRLCIGVLGFFTQGSREQLQSFLLLVILHQPVAHHHPIIHVAGVVVRQRFQRVPCSLLVAHHLIDAHLRQCDFLALSLDVLDAIDGAKHATIVLVLLVELQQNLQYVGALALVAGQLFIDCLRLRIVPHAEEILSQPLLIDIVVGIQRCRLLQAQPCQRVFSQLTLIHRQVVPAFSGQWVDVETVAEKVVGGIVIACILLPHGLQEEIVVAQRVNCGKRRVERGERREKCGELRVVITLDSRRLLAGSFHRSARCQYSDQGHRHNDQPCHRHLFNAVSKGNHNY